jgi:peptidoglycan hydrolase CwlO-like protein
MRIALMTVLMFVLMSNALDSFAQDDANPDTNLQRDKERLNLYQDRIEEQKSEIIKIKKEEKSVFDKMRYIRRLIDKKRRELNGLNEKRQELDNQIKDISKQIKELKKKVITQKEHLQKRSVVLYKISGMQYLKIIFSSSSYTDRDKNRE